MTLRRATYTLCVIPAIRWLSPPLTSASTIHLVAGLDRAFDRLGDHQDQTLKTFLLDGQTALLETYLTLRPERYDQIEALIQDGSLMIGPWYVQPAVLTDIELLIRNLSIGRRTAQAFGAASKVAYLSRIREIPAHLAQVLRGFQLEAAIVPPTTDQPAVLEVAQPVPDGSHMLFVHLKTAAVEADPDVESDTIETLADTIEALRTDSAPNSAASCLLIPYLILNEENPANSTLYSANLLPDALLAVHDRHHDTVVQTTLDQYAASVLPLLPQLPTVPPARIEADNSQLLITVIIGSNEDPEAAAKRLLREMLDWIEPAVAWADSLPMQEDQPLLRSPQRAIEQIWRGLLRDAENYDDHETDSLYAFGSQLTNDALSRLAAAINTAGVGTEAVQSFQILFRSDHGIFSYVTRPLTESRFGTLGWKAPDPYSRQIMTDRHEGILPPSGSLLTSSTANFRITAIKLPDDQARNGIVVRGYNSGNDSEMVTLTLWRRWAIAEVLNLDESAIGGKLAVTAEGSIRFRAVPDRLLTFWFHD